MKTEAVVFDLFETLITEFADGKRISNRKYDYLELLGIPDDDFKKEWKDRQQMRMTGGLPDYPAVIEDMMRSRKLAFRKENVERLYNERIAEKRIPFQSFRPDVVELLKQLKSGNMKIGLVSNCTEEEVRAWEGCELAKYVDETIFSYETGLAKPDERIYGLACERLGVAPTNTIFVGDGGSGELEGAVRAGIRSLQAVWFNPYIQSDVKKLHHPRELLDEIDWHFGDTERI